MGPARPVGGSTPLDNDVAAKHLLGRGFRIDPFAVVLGEADRYSSTAGFTPA